MMKYRSKPATVQAFQYQPGIELPDWYTSDRYRSPLPIPSTGDWAVLDEDGLVRVWSDSAFKDAFVAQDDWDKTLMTVEAVEEPDESISVNNQTHVDMEVEQALEIMGTIVRGTVQSAMVLADKWGNRRKILTAMGLGKVINL